MKTNRMQQIEEAIKVLKKNPIPLHELLNQKENEARFIQSYLSSIFSHPEYPNHAKTNPSKPRHITLHDIEELEYALTYLNISDIEQKVTVSHEMAHFEEAQKRGFPARFVGAIFKDKDGRIGCSFATQVNLKYNNLSEEQRRLSLRNVIDAPSNLSEHDRKMLS